MALVCIAIVDETIDYIERVTVVIFVTHNLKRNDSLRGGLVM